jgi:Fe-S oxidoreductase
VLVVGCAYFREAPKEAHDVVRAATGLLGHAPRVFEGCCGLPLLLAGDKDGFARHAERVSNELAGARVLVHDAGCALAMRVRYPSVGVAAPDVELLVERAARELSRLRPASEPMAVRWHDPCSLGRGLGVYDAPRSVLGRVLGAPPLEMDHAREHGVCSGAGGLLPVTMPEVSRAIAGWRTAGMPETIVTACASSLVSFRRAGAKAADVATLIADALSPLKE